MKNVKAAVTRTDKGFVPCTERDEELLKDIRTGVSAVMTFKKMRNPNQHRLYWGILKTVFDNLPEEFDGRYLNIEAFHAEIKFLCGVTEVMETITGERIVKVGSIAFGNMSQDDFKAFLDRALDEIRKYFLPNVDEVPEVQKWIFEKV